MALTVVKTTPQTDRDSDEQRYADEAFDAAWKIQEVVNCQNADDREAARSDPHPAKTHAALVL